MFALESQVRLINCVEPSGIPVTGTWTVIGRRGAELILERGAMVIRVPLHAVRDAATVAPKTRRGR